MSHTHRRRGVAGLRSLKITTAAEAHFVVTCHFSTVRSVSEEIFFRTDRGACHRMSGHRITAFACPGGTVLTQVIMLAVSALIIAGLEATRKPAGDFTGAVGPLKARP